MRMKIDQLNLIEFSEIGSTNQKAVELAEEGAPEWTVVFAHKQTRGKGRYQRVWESPADLGLWFSVVLRPQIELYQLNLINLVTALSIREFILVQLQNQEKDYWPARVRLKWPNDVLVEGRKICGILLESSIRKNKIFLLVVGIGLNLNQKKGDFSPDIRPSATSLKLLTGLTYDLNKSLEAFLSLYYHNLNQALESGFSGVVNSYQKNMLYLDELVGLDLGEKKNEGIVQGLDERGFLILNVNGTQKIISAGDLWQINQKSKI